MITPKDKAFLYIKLVQECMDNQSKMIAIAFGEFLKQYQTIEHQRGVYTYWDGIIGGQFFTTKELYNKFMESINN